MHRLTQQRDVVVNASTIRARVETQAKKEQLRLARLYAQRLRKQLAACVSYINSWNDTATTKFCSFDIRTADIEPLRAQLHTQGFTTSVQRADRDAMLDLRVDVPPQQHDASCAAEFYE